MPRSDAFKYTAKEFSFAFRKAHLMDADMAKSTEAEINDVFGGKATMDQYYSHLIGEWRCNISAGVMMHRALNNNHKEILRRRKSEKDSVPSGKEGRKKASKKSKSK